MNSTHETKIEVPQLIPGSFSHLPKKSDELTLFSRFNDPKELWNKCLLVRCSGWSHLLALVGWLISTLLAFYCSYTLGVYTLIVLFLVLSSVLSFSLLNRTAFSFWGGTLLVLGLIGETITLGFITFKPEQFEKFWMFLIFNILGNLMLIALGVLNFLILRWMAKNNVGEPMGV